MRGRTILISQATTVVCAGAKRDFRRPAWRQGRTSTTRCGGSYVSPACRDFATPTAGPATPARTSSDHRNPQPAGLPSEARADLEGALSVDHTAALDRAGFRRLLSAGRDRPCSKHISEGTSEQPSPCPSLARGVTCLTSFATAYCSAPCTAPCASGNCRVLTKHVAIYQNPFKLQDGRGTRYLLPHYDHSASVVVKVIWAPPLGGLHYDYQWAAKATCIPIRGTRRCAEG